MIKAIETSYKGYRFRSRLEARWAVFFEELGLKWEYEPQGFVLSDGTWYLPDFRVRSLQNDFNWWYEVKSQQVTNDAKLRRFADDLEKRDEKGDFAHLLIGDPFHFYFEYTRVPPSGKGLFANVVCPRCGGAHDDVTVEERDWGFEYVSCWPCDVHTASQNDPETGIAGASVESHKGLIEIVNNSDWWMIRSCVYAAAEAARSARFEHGECG